MGLRMAAAGRGPSQSKSMTRRWILRIFVRKKDNNTRAEGRRAPCPALSVLALSFSNACSRGSHWVVKSSIEWILLSAVMTAISPFSPVISDNELAILRIFSSADSDTQEAGFDYDNRRNINS